eukprot:jgi/Botrbrau1/12338/Bobra.4_3s0010.1
MNEIRRVFVNPSQNLRNKLGPSRVGKNPKLLRRLRTSQTGTTGLRSLCDPFLRHSVGGAYIISSPRVPGHAHFNFFLSTPFVY